MQGMVVGVIVFSCWFTNVEAAVIEAVNSDCFFKDKCREDFTDAVLIKGPLGKGDAAKFRDVVRGAGLILNTVILRSNGGDVMEAMTIGHDIRKLLLETEGPSLDYNADQALLYLGGDSPYCIENGYHDYKGSRFKGTDCSCASACFLIYAAGAKRRLSYVGIHRVYFDRQTYGEMSLEQASHAYERIRRPLADYLDEMGVARRYADIMLQTSSQDIYVPKYPEMMAEFVGWIPEIEEWLIARCHTISEKQLEQDEKAAFQSHQIDKWIAFRNARSECIFNALLEDRIRRRKAY
jgi:hypothetical protein